MSLVKLIERHPHKKPSLVPSIPFRSVTFFTSVKLKMAAKKKKINIFFYSVHSAGTIPLFQTQTLYCDISQENGQNVPFFPARNLFLVMLNKWRWEKLEKLCTGPHTWTHWSLLLSRYIKPGCKGMLTKTLPGWWGININKFPMVKELISPVKLNERHWLYPSH